MLIFLRWREAARHWRSRRLGHLAAKLHFEGTLAFRMFANWHHLAKWKAWERKQAQAGLAMHWVRLEKLVFFAWMDLARLSHKLRSIADGQFVKVADLDRIEPNEA